MQMPYSFANTSKVSTPYPQVTAVQRSWDGEQEAEEFIANGLERKRSRKKILVVDGEYSLVSRY